jgi:3D (Asp-Asp-Asp) domain-containing protein
VLRPVILFFLLVFFSPRVFALTYEVVKGYQGWALAYTSEHAQTDHDPFSTATGTTPKWGTVAANHLPLWTRIKIEGFGEKVFTVEDRLHKRYKKVIDLWFPNKKLARQFGKRFVKYWVLKNVRPLPD